MIDKRKYWTMDIPRPSTEEVDLLFDVGETEYTYGRKVTTRSSVAPMARPGGAEITAHVFSRVVTLREQSPRTLARTIYDFHGEGP